MKSRRSIVLAGLAGLLATTSLLLGCGDDEDGPTTPVPGGNTPFDSGVLGNGSVFLRTFPVAGTVPYFCTPHASSGMTGSVTVSAGSSVDTAEVIVAPGGALVYNPTSVTVKVTGVVRWTWASGGHTVTSGVPTAANARMPATRGMATHSGH